MKADPSRTRPPRRRVLRPTLSHLLVLLLPAALLLSCSACSSPGPQRPKPYDRGVASWYGGKFHGRPTASGETYDQLELTAAHRTLPFGTVLEVTNLDNGRKVRVRVNDRGPFVRGRILDLSLAAAREIGMVGPGLARVEIAIVAPADPAAALSGRRYTVQLGAFVDRRRAEALAATLAERHPEVMVRSDGTWHRVQLGEFTSRRTADNLRRRLAKEGYVPLVVPVR